MAMKRNSNITEGYNNSCFIISHFLFQSYTYLHTLFTNFPKFHPNLYFIVDYISVCSLYSIYLVNDNKFIETSMKMKINRFIAAVKTIQFCFKLLPVKSTNYCQCIWQLYGPLVSKNVWYWGKSLIKLQKLKYDLAFLKTCKFEKLTPKFARFHVTSTHAVYKKAIQKCYWEILLKEIKIKKRL